MSLAKGQGIFKQKISTEETVKISQVAPVSKKVGTEKILCLQS